MKYCRFKKGGKMTTYKEMLNKIMQSKNWNQEQLATALKVDKAQITRWLGSSSPNIENLRKIKRLYDEVCNERK